MNRRVAALLVAGACAAAVAVTTLSAHATTESLWMVCPDGGPVRTGHLEAVTFTGTPAQPYTFDVSGTITPCHPTTGPGVGFAVAEYGPGGAYTVDGGYRSYYYLQAGDTFLLHVRIGRWTKAVCLISNEDTRLDCIGFTATADGNPVVGTRIPTDAPDVDRPAGYINYEHGKPGCPTCSGE
jgi:hypothetical protein